MDRLDMKLWKRIIALAKPYWFSDQKKTALGLLVVLLALLAAVNGLNVVINFVAGNFMTALSERKQDEFYRMLMIYGSVFVVGTPIVVYYSWIQKKLALKWREWLTNHLMAKYFRNRAYYRINNDTKIDNPDERLANDVSAFCSGALSLMMVVLGSIITFCSFIAILWRISTPLVAIVTVYAIAGTLITYWFGRRLIGINFNQLRREADFRYGLVHVRNNTESIAFYQGEEKEREAVKKRFGAAIFNFNVLIGWQRNLGFVTTGYNYMIVLIPALIIAPLYFSKQVEFGVFTQADMAFTQILSALSLVVASFTEITTFAAVVNRLCDFSERLDELEKEHNSRTEVIEISEDGRFAMDNMTLKTPNANRTLVQDLTLDLAPAGSLLITGPSGAGKSSLLRSVAGLWNTGKGKLTRPSLDDTMFLPQKPYMILGTLRNQLMYPKEDAAITDEEMQKALAQVNLADLPARIGGFDIEINFADVLSLGEQQRLAFARLLLHKPKHAILDEATSALDAENEERLYGLLKDAKTTVVSVGHRSSLKKHHEAHLNLKGDGTWNMAPTAEFAPIPASATEMGQPLR